MDLSPSPNLYHANRLFRLFGAELPQSPWLL
jgi:hypothetical protein